MTQPSPTIRQIFEEAIEIEDPDQQQALISAQCQGDDQCVGAVQALLDAHAAAAEFMPSTHSQNAEGPGTIASTPSHVFGRGDTIGDYKLLQQIGEGGMGTVWMAEQLQPVQRRVAVKLIRNELGSRDMVARFEAERQALALMDHQNIARVFDAGTTESGTPWFAMELVKGISITHYCDQNKLGIRERLELLIPVCHAIQHAHQKSVVHRDLKPSNVLVTLYDGKPVPKIIDFGLAKALGHQVRLTDKTLFTEFGKIVGTWQYMSPEQAEMNALDVDTRTDIYSIGIMMYELLAGSTPLEKSSLHQQAVLQILATIRETEPPRPSIRVSESGHSAVTISQQRRMPIAKLQEVLRGELDWIVMRSIEKDRTRRYETAAAFADDISNYLTGEVVTARPPSTTYRIGKYVRRHKGLVTSVAAIATLLIAGIIGTSWFALAANQARRLADTKASEALQQKRQAEQERERANANEKQAVKLARESRESDANAKLSLATAFWKGGEVKESQDVLYQIPVDYRGDEWIRRNHQFLGSDMTICGTSFPIKKILLSPDDSRIYSLSERSIMAWDTITGRGLGEIILRKNESKIIDFDIHGRQLVTLNSSDEFTAWNLETFHKVKTVSTDHSELRHIRFVDQGKIVTVIGEGVEHWNAQDYTLTWDCEYFADYWATDDSSVTVSPSGKLIAIETPGDVFTDGDILVIGNEGFSLRCKTKIQIAQMCISPSEEFLAVGKRDGNVSILSLRSGEENAHAYKPRGFTDDSVEMHVRARGDEQHAESRERNQPITAICFSPDEKTIAFGNHKNEIVLWDLTTDALVSRPGHAFPVTSLCYSHDGSNLISGDADGRVKRWPANVRQPGDESGITNGRRKGVGHLYSLAEKFNGAYRTFIIHSFG